MELGQPVQQNLLLDFFRLTLATEVRFQQQVLEDLRLTLVLVLLAAAAAEAIALDQGTVLTAAMAGSGGLFLVQISAQMQRFQILRLSSLAMAEPLEQQITTLLEVLARLGPTAAAAAVVAAVQMVLLAALVVMGQRQAAVAEVAVARRAQTLALAEMAAMAA